MGGRGMNWMLKHIWREPTGRISIYYKPASDCLGLSADVLKHNTELREILGATSQAEDGISCTEKLMMQA
jgi:hypothetical protein